MLQKPTIGSHFAIKAIPFPDLMVLGVDACNSGKCVGLGKGIDMVLLIPYVYIECCFK